MMHKFYVREAKSPRKSPFTFKTDGFYNVLKSRVAKKLSFVDNSNASVKSMLVVDTYILIALALCVGMAQTQNFVLAFLAGIVLGFGTVASHNFTHLKDNWRMYYVQLSLMSVRSVLSLRIILIRRYYSIINTSCGDVAGNGEYRTCSVTTFSLIPYRTWR